MRLIAKVIRTSRAKFHRNRLTTVRKFKITRVSFLAHSVGVTACRITVHLSSHLCKYDWDYFTQLLSQNGHFAGICLIIEFFFVIDVAVNCNQLQWATKMRHFFADSRRHDNNSRRCRHPPIACSSTRDFNHVDCVGSHTGMDKMPRYCKWWYYTPKTCQEPVTTIHYTFFDVQRVH